ncbi:FMN-binding protein [Patescibacteria group bacterium]|nr:FMN-binding protein [Patescibacteria group bacterium]
MKKFVLSGAVAFAFVIYIVFNHNSRAGTVIPPASLANIPLSQLPGAASGQVAQAPAQTPTPASTSPAPAPAAATPPPTPAPAPAQSQPAPVSTPPPPPPKKNLGQYVDGNYTGSVADAYYGYVQVQVSVSGGKITGVQFLQYPNDRSTSRYINGQAMPYLIAEAIQAQNANVDVVSGATDTSMAFRQSLADALSQAKS